MLQVIPAQPEKRCIGQDVSCAVGDVNLAEHLGLPFGREGVVKLFMHIAYSSWVKPCPIMPIPSEATDG